MSRSVLLLVGLVAALVGVGSWLWPAQEAPPNPPLPQREPEPPPPLAERWGCQFRAGQQMAYSGKTRHEVSMEERALADSAGTGPVAMRNLQQHQVEATFRLDLEVEAAGVDATLVGELHVTPVKSTMATAPWTAALRLRVDADCGLSAIALEPRLDPRLAQESVAMLRLLRFRYPAAGSSTTEHEEVDADSTVTVRYSSDGLGPGRTVQGEFVRQTLRRDRQPGLDGQAPGVRDGFRLDVRSESSLALPGTAPWFTSSRGLRAVRTRNGAIASERTAEASAVAVQPGWRPRPVDLAWVDDDALAKAVDAQEEELDRQKYAKMTMDDALAEFAKLRAAGANAVERKKPLIAWLRADPRRVAQLVAWIRAGKVPDLQTYVEAIVALVRSQLPQAHRAAMDLLRDPTVSRQGRMQALVSLAWEAVPLPPDLQPLLTELGRAPDRELGDGLVSQLATSQLGVLAHLRKDDAPEAAAAALAELRARLDDAEAPPQKLKDVLIGAANAKDDGLFASVEPYMKHADAEVSLLAWQATAALSAATLAPRLDALLAQATTENQRIALFRAMAQSFETAEGRVPAHVVAMTLSLYEQLPVHGSANAEHALAQLLMLADRRHPEDSAAKAALAARLVALVKAGGDKNKIKELAGYVGVGVLEGKL